MYEYGSSKHLKEWTAVFIVHVSDIERERKFLIQHEIEELGAEEA